MHNGKFYDATVIEVAATRLLVEYALDGTSEYIANEEIPERVREKRDFETPGSKYAGRISIDSEISVSGA